MRRRPPTLAALCALVLGLVSVVPRADAWSRPPERIAGNDRYATAAAISAAVFDDGAATVVVASGESFPDGLAAGPLAALYDAPVLLTSRHAVPASTIAEIERLEPQRVLIVGGTAAVSDAVLAQLEATTEVEPSRIAGATRYDTATAVASLFPAPAPIVFVASGANFPDALAGGAAAAMATAPLLLTPPDSLPQAVGDQLRHLAPPETLVLGGPGAVSEAVVAEIDAAVQGGVRRLAGGDRYATATVIAADRAGTATRVVLATGASFPDALAAAPLARHLGAPILLTSTCAPHGTIEFQRDRSWPDVTIVGGSAAVPEFGLSLPCAPVPDGAVAPGVTMTTHVLPGPSVARVLTVDRSVGAIVRPVMAAGTLVGRLTTTEVARGHGAPVAINGTFFTESGETSFAMAIDGRLVKAPGAGGTLIALDRGKPTYSLFTIPDFDITVGDLDVDRVNSGAPGSGEVALFTREDARVTDVGTDYCRADLSPNGDPALDEAYTVQRYTVDDTDCGAASIDADDDTDILAALEGSTEGELIASMPLGDVVELRWRVHPDVQGARDLIGSNISLVHGSAVSSDVTMNTGPFYNERAPRTAIGSLPDGRLLIVVVDGRQPGWSIGLTPRELADFLVSLGADYALNLDGGGSTSLSVDGVLANRPSGGAQRSVGSVLLVGPG